jgi:hypothetical protein
VLAERVSAESVPAESVPAESVPGARRAVDVLHDLASHRAFGTLILPRTDERIVVRDGRVVLVESPRSPSLDDLVVGSDHLDAVTWAAFKDRANTPSVPPGMSAFTWERMCRETTLDAAMLVLTDDPGEAEFRAGSVPCWTGSIPAMEPDRLVREVGRRNDVLRRLRPSITPRTVVSKAQEGSWERIQVTVTQWTLLVEVQDGDTPLEVSPRIGHGVTSATFLCYELMRLGLLRVGRDNDRRRAEPVGKIFL